MILILTVLHVFPGLGPYEAVLDMKIHIFRKTYMQAIKIREREQNAR